MSLRLAIVLALAATGCESSCLEAQQEGPGLTGVMTYTTGDGTRIEKALGGSYFSMIDVDAIEHNGSFTDPFERTRNYTVTIRGIPIGTHDLSARGTLCMQRQTGGDSVCSPLAGTIDVRQLDADCYQSSGFQSCAETIDVTIHATSDWETTRFTYDAEMLTVGMWVDSDVCD